ncbi:MAG: SRPBCC family protein [Nannocystaceae bacterium]
MFSRDLRTVVDIQASVAKVWRVLFDTARYPEWNPMVREISCPKGLAPRMPIKLTFRVGPVVVPGVAARVTKFQPERVLAWKGGLAGLQTGEHYFVLAERPGGVTRVIHGERWRGVAVAPVIGALGSLLFAGYRELNQALRERCEQDDA